MGHFPASLALSPSPLPSSQVPPRAPPLPPLLPSPFRAPLLQPLHSPVYFFHDPPLSGGIIFLLYCCLRAPSTCAAFAPSQVIVTLNRPQF